MARENIDTSVSAFPDQLVLVKNGDTLCIVDEDYKGAVQLYSSALDAIASQGSSRGGEDESDSDDLQCMILLRRSAAKLRCGDSSGALQDAEDAAELRPGEANAYFRRGIALFQMQKYSQSLEVFKKSERLKMRVDNSGNDDVSVVGLQRWMQKAELEIRAAAGEETPSIVDAKAEKTSEVGASGNFKQQNQNELKQQQIELEACQDAHQTEATGSLKKEESVEPKSDTQTHHEVNVTWKQKESSVTISVHLKGVDVENVSFAFFDREARIVVRERKDKGGEIIFKKEWKLARSVIRSECRCLVMDNKINLKLVKKEESKWDTLEDEASILLKSEERSDKAIKLIEQRGPPASRVFPSSSKTSRDWNKIENDLKEEEEGEKLNGDAALNKLFQDIYAKADDDTRRAMQKSFVESNGTVLSTNWKEIGAKQVDVQAPGGMEVRRYEQ